MRTYDFTVILSEAPTDEQAESLYGLYAEDGPGPASVQVFLLGVSVGVPYAACGVKAESFEAALRDVLPYLRKEGLDMVRVEMDREEVASLVNRES